MARTPIHPGVHLAEELEELGMSAAELSRQIDVPVNRITAIINAQAPNFGSICRASTNCVSRVKKSAITSRCCRH